MFSSAFYYHRHHDVKLLQFVSRTTASCTGIPGFQQMW